MEVKEFVCNLVLKLNDDNFEYLKEKLVGEYLLFSFIEDEYITRGILTEKLYDYFEKLEIKTSKKDILSAYIDDIDSIVGKKIKKKKKRKKKDVHLTLPRSRKYYYLA